MYFHMIILQNIIITKTPKSVKIVPNICISVGNLKYNTTSNEM